MGELRNPGQAGTIRVKETGSCAGELSRSAAALVCPGLIVLKAENAIHDLSRADSDRY